MEWDQARMKSYYFYRCEEDVSTFLRHPLCAMGSDGSAVAPEGKVRLGVPHPRFYGAHVRLSGGTFVSRPCSSWRRRSTR